MLIYEIRLKAVPHKPFIKLPLHCETSILFYMIHLSIPNTQFQRIKSTIGIHRNPSPFTPIAQRSTTPSSALSHVSLANDESSAWIVCLSVPPAVNRAHTHRVIENYLVIRLIDCDPLTRSYINRVHGSPPSRFHIFFRQDRRARLRAREAS